MQALILAGGKGTRLRPLTVYTPKPIVPICNRPFLLYQIDTLRRAGITDITLSLSYQPNKIEHLLGDGSDYGVKLKFATDGSVTQYLVKTVSGTDTTLASAVVSGLTYNPGDVLDVVTVASGTSPTTLESMVWKAGTTQPSSWQLTTTDSTSGYQTAGSVGVNLYLGTSATNAPMTVSLSNFWAGPSQAGGNQPPKASFTNSTSGLGVSVDGSGSSDPDGSISSYAWDFGDGTTGSSVTASHTYAAAGNARTEIDRWATRAKTSWIETVEGIWVNPDFVVSARLVDLPTRPAAIEA